MICALEPKECSTLFNNGRGTHRIEGIGDKMVTLIHNVLTTDYVALIHDDDCVMGLELLERRLPLVEALLGLPQGKLACLEGMFGISGICNILGAIRLARHLNLGPGGQRGDHRHRRFRPLSFRAGRPRRTSRPDRRGQARRLVREVFRGGTAADILDVRPRAEKERLFAYKEEVWSASAIPTPTWSR